jgi:hypothetical protein
VCGAPSPEDLCDPEATAVQNAVAGGMIVVVAAGNEGETGLLSTAALNTMDSPADAPNAIAVAATTNSHNWGNAVTVNGLGSYLGQFGDGPMPTSTITGQLGDIANVGDPLGCTAPPAGSLSGLIALVGRGTCTFLVKIQSLETAGAVGAIVYNSSGDDTLLEMGGLNGTSTPPSLSATTMARLFKRISKVTRRPRSVSVRISRPSTTPLTTRSRRSAPTVPWSAQGH